MTKLINSEKNKIQKLCNDTVTQIEEFPCFQHSECTEKLLEKLIAASTELDWKKNIFDQISEWNQVLIQTDEMEKGSNDPNRFKNRGGKLLEEEKKKKLLRKKLIRVFYIVLRFLNKFI